MKRILDVDVDLTKGWSVQAVASWNHRQKRIDSEYCDASTSSELTGVCFQHRRIRKADFIRIHFTRTRFDAIQSYLEDNLPSGSGLRAIIDVQASYMDENHASSSTSDKVSKPIPYDSPLEFTARSKSAPNRRTLSRPNQPTPSSSMPHYSTVQSDAGRQADDIRASNERLRYAYYPGSVMPFALPSKKAAETGSNRMPIP